MNEDRSHVLSQTESEKHFRERILPSLLKESGPLRPIERPTVMVIGGQPGAGKSTSIERIEAELASQGGVIQANVDALREFHPDYADLVELNDKAASNHTYADARRWSGMVEEYAKANRYNVMVESLLGSPNGLKGWFDDYRQHGYSIEVRVVAVNERSSSQSVVNRYEEEKAAKGHGRKVDLAVHDTAYSNVLDTIETVEKQKLADRVVVHARNGRILYDTGVSPDARSERALDARQAIEAERGRSLSPREWREHIQGFDQIQANQQRPGRNPALSDVEEVRQLRLASVREGGLTAQVGLHPALSGGGAAAGIAATAHDTLSTSRQAAELYDQDNAIGAQSQILHFGARNVGGWAGAVAGAKLGTLAGIESGPGMVLTGIAGTAIGAWGADRVVEWVEHHRINTQADPEGHLWRFDPKQPDKGWTRQVDTEQVDLNASNAYAAAKTGAAFYRQETLVADAQLTQRLNYQASSRSVQLRLSEPDIPLDPYRIAADATDAPSLRAPPWTRNALTGHWSRNVADGLMDRSIHVTAHQASPEKAAELDLHAQSVIAYNAARAPAAIAHRFEQIYATQGWPVPDAIAHARARSDTLLASDGNRYVRGQEGTWTHGGETARGNLKDELDATHQALQRLLGQAVENPAATVQPSVPAVPADARSQTPPAAPEPVPVQTLSLPNDLRDPAHPGHAGFQRVLGEVHRMEQSHGLPHGPHSQTVAAALLVEAERAKLQITNVERDADQRLHGIMRIGASQPERRVELDPRTVAATMEQLSAHWAQARSAHYLSAAPAAERTQDQARALALLPPEDRRMFDTIRAGTPGHIPDEVVGSALSSIKQSGLHSAAQIARVEMVGERLMIGGATPGFGTAVDVSQPAPALQTTVEDSLRSTQQHAQLQEEAQRQQRAQDPGSRSL